MAALLLEPDELSGQKDEPPIELEELLLLELEELLKGAGELLSGTEELLGEPLLELEELLLELDELLLLEEILSRLDELPLGPGPLLGSDELLLELDESDALITIDKGTIRGCLFRGDIAKCPPKWLEKYRIVTIHST